VKGDGHSLASSTRCPWAAPDLGGGPIPYPGAGAVSGRLSIT
jgi:hypothetical protein